ncbi:hypothetical protein BH11PLA2_BH11PLA2_44890 [soil metagenome]
MAVGLTLTAALASDERRFNSAAIRDWLARAAVWFEAVGDAVLDAHLDRDVEGRPHLRVAFHPAADDVDVRISSGGKLKLIARTSPAGPGYHAYLCTLLRQFALDFEFTWEEPPGDHDAGRYFVAGDRARLDSAFHHWLSNRCSQVLSKPSHTGSMSVGLSKRIKYLHPGPVLTPLGPQSLEWLKAVAEDEHAGIHYFPWREAVLNAEFYRNRAVTRMWLDCPWRPPLTEFEGEMFDEIAADLANALDMDEDLPLPWGAWKEIIACLETDAGKFTVEPIAPELKLLVLKRAAEHPAPPLGYRRHPVRVPLTGGWQIEIPGPFATGWDDDGQTWNAWDAGRTIWFRGVDVEGQSAEEVLDVGRANLPNGEQLPSRTKNGVLGEAVFSPHQEEDQELWRLSGIAAADGRMAACNVYVKDLADKDWALATWRSLKQDG